jgi:GST-like protein
LIDLYTCATPNGYGVTIVLEELGLPYELHDVDLTGLEHKQPPFLKLNPNGRVPALYDRDTGITVWESGAIRLYLAEKTGKLLPKDPRRRWQAIAWSMLKDSAIGPNQSQARIFDRFFPEHIPSVVSRFRNEVRRLYGVIDGQLKNQPYLAGEYSIADCGLWPWVRISHYAAFTLDEYPHVKEWHERVGQRSAVQRGLVPPFNPTDAQMTDGMKNIMML